MSSDHASKPNWPQKETLRRTNVATSGQKLVEDGEDYHTSRIARVTPNGAGAFSVSLSARDMTLHSKLVIVFDEVLLDIDGNYHTGDGVYRVPVSGVYVFTWCMTGTTTDNVVTELTVNGSPRGTIFSDAETGHTWDTSTGVIVTSVIEGDHVFIRSKSEGMIHSSGIYGKAMFSGWRLT
ncbi:complement C1q tumor necrosis factor-related protein 2-like [Pecten maximus]|uniref:complement C1q tumor necrosis factor-related protein 2-like n=1 Tax=Pecten maximus TaxID=6579 RepID=UPI0014583A2C|nr:complement C1q tumor necrosis factor-related protein 2-like [Pecten maximus]